MTVNNRKRGMISRFFHKQGFTFALVICLLAIGVTAIFAATNNSNSDPQEPQKDVSVIEQQDDTLAQAQASPAPTQTPAETQKPVSSTVVLTMPLDGNITKEASLDKFVFFKTLNTWATHNGIDIAAGDNKNVKAALGGTVESVQTDEAKGVTVTISHSDKQKTVYVGLKEVTVKQNDKVEAGSVIGTVGTPSFEASDGEHLHFEYLVNGKYVDPSKYFSQNK